MASAGRGPMFATVIVCVSRGTDAGTPGQNQALEFVPAGATCDALAASMRSRVGAGLVLPMNIATIAATTMTITIGSRRTVRSLIRRHSSRSENG